MINYCYQNKDVFQKNGTQNINISIKKTIVRYIIDICRKYSVLFMCDSTQPQQKCAGNDENCNFLISVIFYPLN